MESPDKEKDKKRRDEQLKAISENIAKAQEQQKRQYDRWYAVAGTYSTGTLVLEKDLARKKRKGGKLDEKWEGPFQIIANLGKGMYRLEEVRNKKILQRVCGMHMKPYRVGDQLLDDAQQDDQQLDDGQLDDSLLDDPQLDDPQLDDPQLDDPQLDDPQLDDPQLDDPQLDDPQLDDPQLDDQQPAFLEGQINNCGVHASAHTVNVYSSICAEPDHTVGFLSSSLACDGGYFPEFAPGSVPPFLHDSAMAANSRRVLIWFCCLLIIVTLLLTNYRLP